MRGTGKWYDHSPNLFLAIFMPLVGLRVIFPDVMTNTTLIALGGFIGVIISLQRVDDLRGRVNRLEQEARRHPQRTP